MLINNREYSTILINNREFEIKLGNKITFIYAFCIKNMSNIFNAKIISSMISLLNKIKHILYC